MKSSVKRYSELPLHADYRWDSEFLCNAPYHNPNMEYTAIGDILVSSQYGLSLTMDEKEPGTKIYRMNEITNMHADRDVLKFADIDIKTIQKFRLQDRDVLFNRTNSQVFVGRTGIYRKFSEEPYVFASYLIRLTPNSNVILPEYLTAFLNTEHGIKDVKRRARISINQSNVNAEEIKRVQIPLLSKDFQLKIKDCFDNFFNHIRESESTFALAQNAILKDLNLLAWHPNRQLFFVRKKSDVAFSGRYDAEYYQPKYDDIISRVKNYRNGWETIENLVESKSDNYIPENKTSYQYVELSHVGSYGEITGCIVEEGENLPTRARCIISENDIIVSSVEGSLSQIAMVDKKYHKSLCSTGFYVLQSNTLNPETLLVLLKSFVGQLQLKKGCSGTILTAINKEYFNEIVLPIITDATQVTVKNLINQSFLFRTKAIQFINMSKQAVEMAIEHNEIVAQQWLDEKIIATQMTTA